MVDIADTIWLLIGGIIVTIILGLLAGFSPTLYMTQIGIGAQIKRNLPYMISIMIGVIVALVILTILFQFFHLNTLIEFIDTTIQALLVSVLFNVMIGTALIIGGIWYVRYEGPDTPKPPQPHKKSGYAALISFGFFRTFVSISGVTATFIASNVIAEASPGIVLRIVLTLIFLAAAIVPFVGIIFLLKLNPDRLTSTTNSIKILLKKLNYRPVIGVGAILFGSGIVIYNILMAVFY